MLRRALNEIPAEQKKALYLAYFGDLSQAQIAEYLSLPLGTIKTRIKLGLEKLRKALRPVLTNE